MAQKVMLAPEQVDNYTVLTQARAELKAAAHHLTEARNKLDHISCFFSADETWIIQTAQNIERLAESTRVDASRVLAGTQ